MRWCQQQSEEKRLPAPADSAGAFKFRDSAHLRQGYEEALKEAAAAEQAAAAPISGARRDAEDAESDRVGWNRNENEKRERLNFDELN